MGDDVAGAVDFDGVKALQCMGAVGSDGGGHEAGPADQPVPIIAAEEVVAGDGKGASDSKIWN